MSSSKENLTRDVTGLMRSIWRLDIKVTKIAKKYIYFMNIMNVSDDHHSCALGTAIPGTSCTPYTLHTLHILYPALPAPCTPYTLHILHTLYPAWRTPGLLKDYWLLELTPFQILNSIQSLYCIRTTYPTVMLPILCTC